LAPEALIDTRGVRGFAAAVGVIALALSIAATDAHAVRAKHPSHRATEAAPRRLPYPQIALPLEISGSQYMPLAWSQVAGWNDDDHLAAYKAFRVSCRPIAAQGAAPADPKALGTSLRDPCRIAKDLELSDGARARAFFEQHFLPLRISRLGEGEGFVTGYYEPIIDGSRTQNEVYNVPVYRRPSNLFVRGVKPGAVGLPNKGQVFQDRAAQTSALLRSRRDRGRCHRRTRARNLLAQKPDRFAVRPDPGLGPRSLRGRLNPADQIRCP